MNQDNTMKSPPPVAGMRHVALFVESLERCERFYVDVLGMTVEWRPDNNNVYLTSGCDNVALHRARAEIQMNGPQRLDHIGFILQAPDEVDNWYEFMQGQGVKMKAAPRNHRDGTRSFYCEDPDGNIVQMIYHPQIAAKCRAS
jgi:catechol 2,3-dioxygenase-like lactoylglutathione lyase family enzyme